MSLIEIVPKSIPISRTREISLFGFGGERPSALDGLPEMQASPYHPLLPQLALWKLHESAR